MFANLGIVALSALIPLIIGFIWYNPKVFGKAKMKASWLNEEKLKGANMPLIFGLCYVLSFLMGVMLFTLVVHQTEIYSVFMNKADFGQEGSATLNMIQSVMDEVGNDFRTFKHGALHGTILGICIILPIMAINALFECKGGRYIFINSGYWIGCLALMGGVLCQWG